MAGWHEDKGPRALVLRAHYKLYLAGITPALTFFARALPCTGSQPLITARELGSAPWAVGTCMCNYVTTVPLISIWGKHTPLESGLWLWGGQSRSCPVASVAAVFQVTAASCMLEEQGSGGLCRGRGGCWWVGVGGGVISAALQFSLGSASFTRPHIQK